ncbi:MAG: hypothetical protein FJ117_01560 [Deltaproteobacteria bacterium]|nr:hypothetical protein [Deltaproteobacteria bacterium]
MRKKFSFSMIHLTMLGLLGYLLIHSGLAGQGHGHKAHHGGVLNVIGKEFGHVEILVREDMLEAWFVGGGHDTGRSVPIQAAEIPLTVIIPGKGSKKLVLKADPMKLAGERIGHCSHFTARAEWLREVKEFEAQGETVFKGIRHKLVIKYPRGYDPIHPPKRERVKEGEK